MNRLRTRIQAYKNVHELSYGKLAKRLNTNSGTIWKFLHGGPTVRAEFSSAFEALVERDRKRLYITDASYLLPKLDEINYVCMDSNLTWRAFKGFPVYSLENSMWRGMDGDRGIPLAGLVRLPHDETGSDQARYKQYPDGWKKENDE